MASSQSRITHEELQQRLCTQFEHLGYRLLDAQSERSGNYTPTGRERDQQVVLEGVLYQALETLNTHIAPALRSKALHQAIEQLTSDHSQQGLVAANREIYYQLKEGVPTEVQTEHGGKESVTVKIINWQEPEKNNFLLVSNFWLNGQEGRSCLEFVGFVNGLPLLLPLVRAAGTQRDPLHYLYEHELSDYRRRFPQLFWYNALILLSDGPHSKLGSMTTPWERFTTWKRVLSEDESPDTSLETMLNGTCEPTRLLDLVENFTLFLNKGDLAKIVAANHQYLGVNAAFERVKKHKEYQGKIGVFWHTQGAGKSYSMIFLEQKVQRRLSGSWKFVIITDRTDLDKQIYENFAFTKPDNEVPGLVQVQRVKDLKPTLSTNHRLIFTLLQKYQSDKPGKDFEKVSDDDQIIVLIDEAHRSQYADLASNMRRALPNASFIGFTGTPLIGEEIHRTQEEFGPYISRYGFLQAIQDGVTVDLAYDNHTPQLHLEESPEIARQLHDLENRAGLDNRQKRDLRKRLLRESALLKSERRLDFVASDIVKHFMERGYMGKGMVVCVDKIATVRLYNRVHKAWAAYRAELEQRLHGESDPQESARLAGLIQFMHETKMAVVFSEADQQGEKKKLEEHNATHPAEQLDFQIHYDLLRSNTKLDEDFKNERNPFRLVFVCSMWMTGFDVPSLSTLYLDHPMKEHTLMQALARPNRVNGAEKIVGQIVDYAGIYEELLEALDTYGQSEESQAAIEMPLTNKSEFIAALERALSELTQFCQQQGIALTDYLTWLEQARWPDARKALFARAANRLVQTEDIKVNFLMLEAQVHRLYQAILPDKRAGEFRDRVYFYREVQRVIFAAMNSGSIDDVLIQAGKIVSSALTIREQVPRWHDPEDANPLGQFNLSELNLDQLESALSPDTAYLQTEGLLSVLQQRLQSMLHVNPRRIDYVDRLQRLVNTYNAGSANIADYPIDVIRFAREVSQEEQRAMREGLSEEELAVADLLAAEVQLDREDWQSVKEITCTLLAAIKSSDSLVHSWYTKLGPNAHIKSIISNALQALPADCYDNAHYKQKCQEVYQYIRVAYANVGNSGPLSA